MLGALQGRLVRGTPGESASSGSVRGDQVVVGRRPDTARDRTGPHAARFVPSPPGLDLRADLQQLLDWMGDRSLDREVDPAVGAALPHYQFESLHPFHDGDGRIGRLLIVVHLVQQKVLLEPTLTVSPWFEARRSEYDDRLFGVSTEGDWDSYVRFFAQGIEASARTTLSRMERLVAVQAAMKERVRQSRLRADTAHALVDYTLGHVTFTVRAAERDLPIGYGRVNSLVQQLVALGILAVVEPGHGTTRRFYAPEVHGVLLDDRAPGVD